MTDNKAQIVTKAIEGAGLATATASALCQWIAENHEVIWLTGFVFGIFLTFVGVCSNVYFGIQRDRREAALHRLELKQAQKAAKAAGK